MSLATYTDLKAAVGNWLKRSDLNGDAADFVTLGEAALNRKLNPVETDATLTGTSSSRVIDVSSLSIVEAKALFLLPDASSDERELQRRQAGTFPYRDEADEPLLWTLDGTSIKFDCLLDAAYSFRFRYRQRFALSDASPTNWLLTYHPDVYLAATLVWGGVFAMKPDYAAPFVAALRDGIPDVRNTIAQQNRAVMKVDEGVLAIGKYCPYDFETDT